MMHTRTRSFRSALIAAAVIGSIAIAAPAGAFPIGFSVNGGAGMSYYSMEALNDHLIELSHEYDATAVELTNGVTLSACARLWFFGRIAVSGGYEHIWAQASVPAGSRDLSFTAPADVYTIGAIVTVVAIPNVAAVNAGANYCLAMADFGTNALSVRRLRESSGTDDGFQIFAEVHSNFIKPIEVGFQLGYRGVRVETLTTDMNEVAVFAPGVKADIDYSGAYFYLMAGLRL